MTQLLIKYIYTIKKLLPKIGENIHKLYIFINSLLLNRCTKGNIEEPISN